MKKFMEKMHASLAVNIIGPLILMLVIFGLAVSVIGWLSFTGVYTDEYATSTYHIADTAATRVNGDHIDDYLAGEETEEYQQTKDYLDTFCKKMSVTIVYVIRVDRSDYGRFESVFNLINNSVDNTNYTEWELGHQRDTTNDEYRRKYIALYEEGSQYETVYRSNTPEGQHPHVTTMVPVKSSSGDVVALLCIQRPMRELEDATIPYAVHIGITTFIIAVLSALFITLFLRKQFVSPVRKVSREATRFAKENTKGEELGEISKIEEIARLARSIDTMETDMVNYIHDLTRATAERERTGTELNMAAQIQDGMLPSDFPAFPDRNEFDVYASMDPARGVGGDFYDFFLVDDDHLCFLIADVSGKGVPAALFMMASKIIIANNAMMGKSPAQILTDTNAAICSNNRMEMFVTVWLGILEISTGKLTAANAGHEYPILKKPDGKFELLKDKHGFVIGGMDGMRYKEYELTLKPGSKLFVYTDGVPEATDSNGDLFTNDRTIDALNVDPDCSPQELLQNVRRAVDDFVKDAEQFDDLTMLCLEYKKTTEPKGSEE